MNIVVVGDGKVGATLVEHLSNEGHDVVVIDRDPKIVNAMVESYDVLGVCGNGASYDVQMEAGVDKARLLIAATSSDELNILCCLMAKKIGAHHTIARVRNPDYAKQLQFIKEELGLSMVINPEEAAASEIARLLRFPTAINIESFAEGAVDLAEIKIEKGNPLDGMMLCDIHKKLKTRILICAVQRGSKVYIPNGNFTILGGDRIHITSRRSAMIAFMKELGIYKHKTKNVMIAGGGKMGFYLARQLSENGCSVKVLELDRTRAETIADLLPKADVICGDASDRGTLIEQGLEQQDAFVALTTMDEENILTTMYASAIGVGKTVLKVNRVAYEILESIGVNSAYSSKAIAANRIIRYVRALEASGEGSVQTLYKLVGDRVEALEFKVSPQNGYLGIPLRTLSIRDDVLVACIIRDGALLYPNGDDTFQPNDSVVIVTTQTGFTHFDEIFN